MSYTITAKTDDYLDCSGHEVSAFAACLERFAGDILTKHDRQNIHLEVANEGYLVSEARTRRIAKRLAAAEMSGALRRFIMRYDVKRPGIHRLSPDLGKAFVAFLEKCRGFSIW